MGENGYMDYVISNGTKIEGVSGNSNVDIFLTDLVGNYSITVVAIKWKYQNFQFSKLHGNRMEPDRRRLLYSSYVWSNRHARTSIQSRPC